MDSTGKEIWDALSGRIAEVAEQASKAVVTVEAGYRVSASGVHWRPGVVVTAAHLVRRTDSVNLILPTGGAVQGNIAGRDGTTDIAVIRLEDAAGLATLPFNSNVRLGELVLAIGRSRRGELAVAAGTIARVGSGWRTWRGGEIDRLLRPDVQLYPGQSGGPLINGNGEVLGINSSILARASAITIPVETVDRVATQLLEHGHISRPYLGVAMQEVPLPQEWRPAGSQNQEFGLLVMHVAPGSPAQHASVLLGDVIVSAESEPVMGYRNLHRILSQRRTGDALRLRLLRGGVGFDANVTLGDRPRQ
jgi:S1-C subfamily serine protease